MGKLSLYKSRQYYKRKNKKYTPGRPFKKQRRFPQKNKDIDTTLSYSDNFEKESTSGIMSHAMNFYCGGDPPCDSLLAGHRNSENSTSSSENSPVPEGSSSASNSEEEDDSADDEPNVWNSNYARSCLSILKGDKLLKPLIEILYANSCLKDFMTLVTSISDGSLSPTNISFLLCLERAKWQSLKTTTQMQFRDVTKKFWLVVYRLLKGKGIRFFSGPKNWGQVVSKDAQLGNYDPKCSEINFAVPDERYLRTLDTKYGKVIPPGIIDDSYKLLSNHPDVVIMADCKRVAKGLRSDRLGDVDLWGHEAKPTLQDKLDKLKEDMERINTIIDDIPDYDNMDIYTSLRSLLRMIMLEIQDIRQIELKERRRLMNYDKLNPDPNFRAAAKSACKTQIYECKIFVHKALQLNLEICECLAKIQNNHSVMMTQNINLSTQFNVRRLLSVEYVSKHIDIHESPHLIKQGSDQWEQFRKESHITGSTAYNTLGFRGFSKVKEHFNEFIYKRPPKPFPTDVQIRLEHGSRHEVCETFHVVT